MTSLRILGAASAGAAVAVLAWVVLVPWDLSEVSEDGRALEGGGDDSASQIALVGVVVVAMGFMVLARRETRAYAPPFVAGGLATWAVLFAWRAGVAETSGASMFLLPLVVIFIPAAVVTPFIVRAVGAHLDGAQGSRVP